VYTVRTGATPQTTPEEVIERTGELIKEVLTRHKLSAKQVSFAIPGRASFVRQLKIPNVSGDRLNRLIQYEARQQIPFPIQDIILDSHAFRTEGPELGVTLVAIRRNTIDQYCEMLKTAGLIPDTIDVTTLSLFDAFYPHLQGEEEDMVALVDVGAATTDIVVCSNDRVEFIRSAPQAGDYLTKSLADNMGLSWEEAEELKISSGEVDPSIDRRTDPLAYGEDDRKARVKLFLSKAADAVANEIRRTLDFYVSQPEGQPIGKIYLTGGAAGCKGFAEFVESRLGIICEVVNPFAKTLVNVSGLETEPLTTTSAVLLGQCQRNIGTVPLRMNFLPPSVVRRKEFEKRRAILVAEGLMLAVLVGFSVVLLQRQIGVYEDATHLLQQKLEGRAEDDTANKIKNKTNSTIHLNDRFLMLDDVGRSRGVISRTLADVAENLPLGQAWLARVDVDTQNMILDVRGGHPEHVVAFKEKFKQVTRLREQSISEEERQPEGGIKFKAAAQVEKNPSPEVSKIREKLVLRKVKALDLAFEDQSDPKGSKQRYVVVIVVSDPFGDADRANLVLEIIKAIDEAEIGDYQEKNVKVILHSPSRTPVGEYRLVHPQPDLILKGEMKPEELTLVEPSL
jgi:type IV pilus assembly protein PilM